MNPTNEQELRDKLDEQLETLLGFLGERDDSDNWWGFDTNVGTLEDEIEGTLDSIMKSIQAYTNAEIARVLDRLEQSHYTIAMRTDGTGDFSIIDVAAIEAERNKLKERDDE